VSFMQDSLSFLRKRDTSLRRGFPLSPKENRHPSAQRFPSF